MIRLYCLHFVIVVQFLACGQINRKDSLVEPDSLKTQKINIDTSEIAIFNINKYWWLKKRFDSSKSFNLNNINIQAIEKVFKKCLDENNLNKSNLHYRRQYVPYINTNGHKCVWVNCFCSDDGYDYPDWKTSIVVVDDGGSCFLNLTIDLTDMLYSNFEINGYA
jgi:hypothetical protein